jgi:cellulose 1,4-beta-cellobiosidase
MYYSALHVGSLAIDINGNRMDVKMIRQTGVIDDYFSIVKDVPNTPPTVAISSPTEGSAFTAPANITITANASDSDGNVAQVDFYAGNTLVGSDTVAPFSVSWTNVAAGNYALTATATDNRGATVTSAAVNIVVSQPPPPAPNGLTATAGDSQVSLSWQSSVGATSYSIKRGTASGGPYNTVASGIGSPVFTDTSVINGVTYYYVATAIGTGGESANSNEASATPIAPAVPPGAPAGLNATAGNAQVSLTWNNSADATSYSVKRSTVSGGPYSAIVTGLTGTSYTDSTALNGTTYYYVVTASNSAGESANSSQVSATPTAPPTAPSGPTNLGATAVSNTQINLAWSDNSNNETGFIVERSTNGNSYSQVVTLGSNVTSYANTGLSSNRKYYYRVRAYNAVGSSAYSNVATAKTPR